MIRAVKFKMALPAIPIDSPRFRGFSRNGLKDIPISLRPLVSFVAIGWQLNFTMIAHPKLLDFQLPGRRFWILIRGGDEGMEGCRLPKGYLVGPTKFEGIFVEGSMGIKKILRVAIRFLLWQYPCPWDICGGGVGGLGQQIIWSPSEGPALRGCP
ncbi:hypothetical protein ACH5RR_036793 [Cinchona calisaya]|uniref:Uncharacterized protein n=1 Tax=Cinchona calisaya TaxID=153742 RepID=A0ABD2Y7V2_9GENT